MVDDAGARLGYTTHQWVEENYNVLYDLPSAGQFASYDAIMKTFIHWRHTGTPVTYLLDALKGALNHPNLS
jgi:hypothetical protein